MLRVLGADEKRALWDAFREWLGGDDARLADPVGYALWCGWFEDPEVVDEAWLETTRREVEPWQPRLQRVLVVAGPVLAAEAGRLRRLIDDSTWHPQIFAALRASAFDYYGALDADSARHWLSRLTLADDTPCA